MVLDRLSGVTDGVSNVQAAVVAAGAAILSVATGAIDAVGTLPAAVAGTLGAFVGGLGNGLVDAVVSLVASRPLITAGVVGAAVVVVVNPGDVRDEATWVAQLVGLAVLGYVAAMTIGPTIVDLIGGVL